MSFLDGFLATMGGLVFSSSLPAPLSLSRCSSTPSVLPSSWLSFFVSVTVDGAVFLSSSSPTCCFMSVVSSISFLRGFLATVGGEAFLSSPLSPSSTSVLSSCVSSFFGGFLATVGGTFLSSSIFPSSLSSSCSSAT